jgi:hypothetical protein
MRIRSLAAVAIIVSACSVTGRANTIGYYRFEEGPAGGTLTGTAGDNSQPHTTTADSSGQGNNLRTYNSPANPNQNFDTSPVYSTDVPAPIVPATGAADNYSFLFTPNDDIYTEVAGTLNPHPFPQFTVEASFKADKLGVFQSMVDKDGQPISSSPIAPLELKVRGDTNQAQIEIIDSNNADNHVESINPVVANKWYNIAAVDDGSTLSLYLDSGSGYVLQGSVPSAGLVNLNSTWDVGRGFYNNGVTDWFNGNIDEVRISDTALSPSQFLFYTPEPASIGMIAIALAAFGGRRLRG